MPTDLSKLTGTVRTLRPQSSNPYGIPWSNVTRWEPAFTNAGKEFGVDPLLMAAMAVIESDANQYRPGTFEVIARDDGFGDGVSIGIMQVKPRIWQWLVSDANPDTPDGNIRLGTAIMARAIRQQGSWQKAITNVYFPSNDPNGTTQNAYVKTVKALMQEMDAQLGATTPPETKPTMTEQDILNLISNRAPGVYISFPFLGLNTDNAGRPVNIYRYGRGHGTTANNMHPGIDIWMPDNTPINAVFGGEVVCVGGNGRVVWGQGCGYFNDDNGGIGNITILTNAKATINGKQYQLKMTYGHCSSSVVTVGQKITDGQRIGTSGIGSGWPHVHLDVTIPAPELNNPAIWNNGGDYHLVDPIPTILNAMGAGTVTPQPTYDAPRIDVPQPGDFDTGWTVEVIGDDVPVKQYASRDAPDVAAPLQEGETFTAVYIAYGRDGEPWWVSDRRGRVPVAGTHCDALEGVL